MQKNPSKRQPKLTDTDTRGRSSHRGAWSFEVTPQNLGKSRFSLESDEICLDGEERVFTEDD